MKHVGEPRSIRAGDRVTGRGEDEEAIVTRARADSQVDIEILRRASGDSHETRRTVEALEHATYYEPLR